MTRRLRDRFNALPWWAKGLVGLLAAVLIAWVANAVWAGVGTFLLAMFGMGFSRGAQDRELGNAEGQIEATVDNLNGEAADLREEVEESKARDAATDSARENQMEDATDAVPEIPPPGWSPPPRVYDK